MARIAEKPLSKRIGSGKAADTEFDRIISILLADRKTQKHTYRNVPQSVGPHLWRHKRCLFFARPPSIKKSATLKHLFEDFLGGPLSKFKGKRKANRLVLAIPETVPCSFSDRSGECKRCPDSLSKCLAKESTVNHWDESRLRKMIVDIPTLGLRYYPEAFKDGVERIKTIGKQRTKYVRELIKFYGRIQFVGMSVYKEEASTSIPMRDIYIPLQVVPEGTEDDKENARRNPLDLLSPGERHVILGDPGSGKSTLVRFLALAGLQKVLQTKYNAKEDRRLPIPIILRRFALALKSKPDLMLLDYVLDVTRSDLDMPDLNRDFFEYYLYGGEAFLLIDGIDELPDAASKSQVREQVRHLLSRFPGNTIIATSRIVGYEREARFDKLGFSHHIVAQLSMNDIERFVSDWYAARIENEVERKRHAQDLIRITRDEVSHAIRELAENPLLLTIICLVHRIDAVLPDERVVLYQKCTETLLNTWHTWKYHGEQIRSRNKTERRNRGRMEAIAYWMHCKMGEEPNARRAVVPYEELRDFLSSYIQEIERVRSGNPSELAAIFLRFVQEKAGLLIEVGDKQYSFVHLTFQEYLAATFLRKSGEGGGVSVVWEFIKDKCRDFRWREAIRLLIGSLEKTESQKYLIERILSMETDSKHSFERAMLAAGCLVDSIDAAEEMREDIVKRLLCEAACVEQIESLREALRTLRTWMAREPVNRDMLIELTRKAEQDPTDDTTRVGLSLNLLSLGVSTAEIRSSSTRLFDRRTREGRIAAGAKLVPYSQDRSPLKLEEKDKLLELTAALGLKSPETNFAAALCATLLPTSEHTYVCPSFEQLLIVLLGPSGPFRHYIRNFAVLSTKASKQSLLSLFNKKITRATYRHRYLNLDHIHQAITKVLNQVLEKALGLFQVPDLSGIRDPVQDMGLNLDMEVPRKLHRVLPLKLNSLTNPEIADPILSILCKALNLGASVQWAEALRLRALPNAPERITLVDTKVWSRTQTALQRGEATKQDLEHAACQLLLDIWLWNNNYCDGPAQSPFRNLADLTRSAKDPMLRIAHCLRDIAYGDEIRIQDLKKMIASNDPEYRRIFEQGFWRDSQTRMKRQKAKKSKKRKRKS